MEFQTFDSFDDMMDAMRRNEEAADAMTAEWQTRIKPGDFVMRHDPSMDLWVYTEVLDPVAEEEKHCDPDDPEDCEHMQYIRERAAHAGNQRFGRHYSAACPEGELGNYHVVTTTAIIPERMFQEARDRDWPEALRIPNFGLHIQDTVRLSHGFVGDAEAIASLKRAGHLEDSR
jgi:hypothetical protein